MPAAHRKCRQIGVVSALVLTVFIIVRNTEELQNLPKLRNNESRAKRSCGGVGRPSGRTGVPRRWKMAQAAMEIRRDQYPPAGKREFDPAHTSAGFVAV